MGESEDDVAGLEPNRVGDMADYFLGLDDYFPDAEDGMEVDEEDGLHAPAESDVTCRRCGEKYLFWENTADGWRLFVRFANGRSEQHHCKPKRAR